MLLGVDVSPEDEGQTVTVSFWSPGWQVQLGCGILAVLLVAAWALLRRRARRDA
jgi:cytochrome bd-type quinol oxidase subunit 1